MKHAIRRLREERLQLLSDLQVVEGDPSSVGGLGAAKVIERELQAEVREVEAAIDLLAFADDGVRAATDARRPRHV